MIPDNCYLPNNKSKIKVEENGRQAIFLNPNRQNGLKPIKIDGCAITIGKRSDYAIEDSNNVVIVELKGTDVKHAADQIIATAVYWKNIKPNNNVAGLIIARQYPRASSKVQLKQQYFARRFGGPLHVVCANCEFKIEKVMSFKGPN